MSYDVNNRPTRPDNGSPYDVALSYAREDHEIAKNLVDVFHAEGLSVWWDQSILPGRSWDEEIETVLRSVKCVVVLWSTHSVKSSWVREEAMYALARNTLVPVLIDAVNPPFGFSRTQAVNLKDWRRGEPLGPVESLLEIIHDRMDKVREERPERNSKVLQLVRQLEHRISGTNPLWPFVASLLCVLGLLIAQALSSNLLTQSGHIIVQTYGPQKIHYAIPYVSSPQLKVIHSGGSLQSVKMEQESNDGFTLNVSSFLPLHFEYEWKIVWEANGIPNPQTDPRSWLAKKSFLEAIFILGTGAGLGAFFLTLASRIKFQR